MFCVDVLFWLRLFIDEDHDDKDVDPTNSEWRGNHGIKHWQVGQRPSSWTKLWVRRQMVQ